MLSAIVTALLLVVMLLIITGLVISAWRAYQRHRRTLQTQTQASTQPLDQPITATLHMQNGILVGVEQLQCPEAGLHPIQFARLPDRIGVRDRVARVEVNG